MKALEHPLIASRQNRQLSALGYKQLSRLIEKACKTNGTNRLYADGKGIAEQVRILVYSLIFDHNISKEKLSDLQRSIKVVNGQLQLPSISTQN